MSEDRLAAVIEMLEAARDAAIDAADFDVAHELDEVIGLVRDMQRTLKARSD